MRINYLLLVHNTSNFRRLLHRLADENIFIYVHVDSKAQLDDFILEARGFLRIKFVSERENVIWGDISMVKATLNLINEVRKDYRGKSYSILMSGSDYPIKPKSYIKKYLENNYGKIFLSSGRTEKVWGSVVSKERLTNYNIHPFPEKRWHISLNLSNVKIQHPKQVLRFFYYFIKFKKIFPITYAFKKRKFPRYLKDYGGSQWWGFPSEVLDYIILFLKNHPDYYTYHKYTHVPDEIFFHSIVSSNFPESQIDKPLTYVNWSRKNCTLPVTFTEQSDLEELKNNNFLFARKFQGNLSKILDSIDEELLNKTMYKHY